MSEEQFWSDDENPELTDSGAETARRLVWLESTTLADYLLALVQAWKYQLRAERLHDIYPDMALPAVPSLCQTGQKMAEKAIQEMWKIFEWDSPMDQEVQDRVNRRIQFYVDQNSKLRSELSTEKDLRKTDNDANNRTRAAIDRKLSVLADDLQAMIQTEVTHSERRGQMKALLAKIELLRQQHTADFSDIPF